MSGEEGQNTKYRSVTGDSRNFLTLFFPIVCGEFLLRVGWTRIAHETW